MVSILSLVMTVSGIVGGMANSGCQRIAMAKGVSTTAYRTYTYTDMGIEMKLAKQLQKVSKVKYKASDYNKDLKMDCKTVSVTAKKDGVKMGLFTVFAFEGDITEDTLDDKSPFMTRLGSKNGYTYTLQCNEISTPKEQQAFGTLMQKYVSKVKKHIKLIQDDRDAKEAYQQYVKSLMGTNTYEKGVYSAVVKISTDYSSVLLVAKNVYRDGAKDCAVQAKLYHYVNGKVVYVGDVQSTGTAYPICVKDNMLLTGYHHTSIKTIVSGKYGYNTVADGIYMEGYGKCFLKKTRMTNGESKTIYFKKISQKTADKKDFYTKNGNYAGKIVDFKKEK